MCSNELSVVRGSLMVVANEYCLRSAQKFDLSYCNQSHLSVKLVNELQTMEWKEEHLRKLIFLFT